MKYSIIPLILHPQGQTGARLLYIPNYQTLPIMTYVLADNILLLLLYLDCTTDQWSIQFEHLHLLGQAPPPKLKKLMD
jgi:hypothetical protein